MYVKRDLFEGLKHEVNDKIANTKTMIGKMIKHDDAMNEIKKLNDQILE